MKKKIITYLIMATLPVVTFITGIEHGKTEAYHAIENTMIDTADIVKWNTDGEELSMVLEDVKKFEVIEK